MRTFCLSGFSETLDFRPVVLLKPPPEELACVFCNVVSATPTALPCGHQACRVCRSEVLRRGNVCPFDRVAFTEDSAAEKGQAGSCENDDVVVQQIEARCFNFPFGCPFTGTLPEVEEHFPNGCNHHKVSCINCSKDVLQRLLAEHIFSGCVEHVPIVPPASSVARKGGDAVAEGGRSEAFKRRLSALEKIIEERIRNLLVSSTDRNQSEPRTLTEENTASPVTTCHAVAPQTPPHAEASTVLEASICRNGSTPQSRESPSSSLTLPVRPSEDLPQTKEEILLQVNSSSPSRDSSGPRVVFSASGALYVAKEGQGNAAANGARNAGDSSDGTLRLGKHDFKLSYSDTKDRNGNRALIFKILLLDDGDYEEHEIQKNGHDEALLDLGVSSSRGPATGAGGPVAGRLALSLYRPSSCGDLPLPTYNLAASAGTPEGDRWTVVALTAETNWDVVNQYVEVNTLHFSLRLQ